MECVSEFLYSLEEGFVMRLLYCLLLMPAGLFPISISSCIIEISIVFVSVAGSFIIVASSVMTFFDMLLVKSLYDVKSTKS
jgi:hypothetical protein